MGWVQKLVVTQGRAVRHPDSTAELRQSGSVCVDCSGRQETRGSAFAPGDFYDYTLHAAEDVPALLAEHAGPQHWIGA